MSLLQPRPLQRWTNGGQDETSKRREASGVVGANCSAAVRAGCGLGLETQALFSYQKIPKKNGIVAIISNFAIRT